MKLTIFYDGFCPLCNAEIKQLKAYDCDNQLSFEDIHALLFCAKLPLHQSNRSKQTITWSVE